jgi:hypothetical protein
MFSPVLRGENMMLRLYTMCSPKQYYRERRTRLKLAKSMAIGHIYVGREPTEGLKMFLVAFDFYINVNECKMVASRKMERNCLVLSSSRWERLLKVI